MNFESGQTIKFKLEDVHMPELSEVVARMTGDLELEGQITLLSDAGNAKAAYAVIQVPGILVPLIVPTTCLSTAGTTVEDLRLTLAALGKESQNAIQKSAQG